MEAFLKHSKDCVGNLSQFTEVHVVLGNEACDLDSMVSSLVYAFSIYEKTRLLSVPVKPTAVIPVFNIPKADFCLRTEAVFLFKRFQLDPHYFTFIEDVNLQNLLDTKRLQLILVDHNILAQTQRHMDVAVIEILGRCTCKK
ncbi:hypothetical protein OS493_003597 [Desmophyllum pertusum]|uniref:Uncharacterized protein n=1 Tax=Desmophyllum pertusum TaxID=174260 RepID=A0A9X0DCP7_9CNID|nr:hypothetical protein OS493_003597 [Desmophyllum pertusum]